MACRKAVAGAAAEKCADPKYILERELTGLHVGRQGEKRTRFLTLTAEWTWR